MNVQPVIPIKITENWNLITRTIVPIIDQPSLFAGTDSASGSATSIRACSYPRPSPASSSGASAPR